jgi:type II secretory pathway pseudopilin PulG
MRASPRAFTLVEVVLALGIFAFVIVALLGLFSAGVQINSDIQNQTQAADLGSRIIAMAQAAPTNAAANAAIPGSALANAYASLYGTSGTYVGFDGLITNTPAAYRISCSAGTTALTGANIAQIHLTLTWPPNASPTNAAGKYETVTYVTLP